MTLLSLDTSFLIDFLSGQKSAIDKMKQIENDGDMMAVSSIVVYELLVLSAGDRKPNNIQKAVNMVESLLSRIGILWSVDPEAARLAAEIQRTQMVKGKPVSVRDLLIAANSLANGCYTIITRNVGDFETIDGIRVETY
ncbi:MAG: type II toxin-antitoxin system VapC family toxin [Candidatus Thorarchaeota archaeon]|nr:type II toxin-antitoxin system VapC family toxin [Candidatus Thorarchaeota archaeon]